MAAVVGEEAVFEVGDALSLGELFDDGSGGGDIVGMDEAHERVGEEFFLGPAQDGDEGGIDLLEVAVGAGDAEHVA